mgnify:CR=1 FL=1
MCGLSDNQISIIQAILRKHKGITKAYIFGSRALGSFKPTSDVDIALQGEITLGLIAGVMSDFDESNLPFCVDVIDYLQANEILKHHIDTQAQAIL